MKNRLKTFVMVFVMSSLWIMPLSFSSALDRNEKAGTAPTTELSADKGGSFTVSPRYYSLNPCERHKFTAEVKDANGRVLSNAEVFWVSTQPDVAFIDEEGFAVAINPGATIIRPVIGQAQGEPASLFVRDNGGETACYNALDQVSSLNQK